MNERCYWCGENATSREHVPPKCIFPEDKDIKLIYGDTFRKSLITVPSCDKHNLEKSHDDEYIMVYLGSRVGNNGVAYIQTNTKISRAIKRNPNLIQVESEDAISIGDRKFPVLLVHIDTCRLMYSFGAIARALIFHEFGFRYDGRCTVVSDVFEFTDNKESNRLHSKGTKTLNEERKQWRTQEKGDNPKIFSYQFSNVIDNIGTFLVALTFYEKTVVYVIMSFLAEYLDEESKRQMKSRLDLFLRND